MAWQQPANGAIKFVAGLSLIWNIYFSRCFEHVYFNKDISTTLGTYRGFALLSSLKYFIIFIQKYI